MAEKLISAVNPPQALLDRADELASSVNDPKYAAIDRASKIRAQNIANFTEMVVNALMPRSEAIQEQRGIDPNLLSGQGFDETEGAALRAAGKSSDQINQARIKNIGNRAAMIPGFAGTKGSNELFLSEHQAMQERQLIMDAAPEERLRILSELISSEQNRVGLERAFGESQTRLKDDLKTSKFNRSQARKDFKFSKQQHKDALAAVANDGRKPNFEASIAMAKGRTAILRDQYGKPIKDENGKNITFRIPKNAEKGQGKNDVKAARSAALANARTPATDVAEGLLARTKIKKVVGPGGVLVDTEVANPPQWRGAWSSVNRMLKNLLKGSGVGNKRIGEFTTTILLNAGFSQDGSHMPKPSKGIVPKPIAGQSGRQPGQDPVSDEQEHFNPPHFDEKGNKVPGHRHEEGDEDLDGGAVNIR